MKLIQLKFYIHYQLIHFTLITDDEVKISIIAKIIKFEDKKFLKNSDEFKKSSNEASADK